MHLKSVPLGAIQSRLSTLETAVGSVVRTDFFMDRVHKDIGVAATPGTLDITKAAELGLAHIEVDSTLSYAHLHLMEDGATGSFTLELYRRRSGAWTQIGSVSLAAGGGNEQNANWTITDSELLAGDYLTCQATAVMNNGKGFVDIHTTANLLA